MLRGVGAAVLIGCALGALLWCSTAYVAANPGRRLPGRLPAAQQPPGYMAVGMVGIALSITGGLLAVGEVSILGWLVAGAIIAAGLLPPELLHNRRLRK